MRKRGASGRVGRAGWLGALLLLSGVGFADEPADPQVVLEAPAAQALVGRSVRVAGRVAQPSGQGVLRVNGKDVALEAGRFETTVVAEADGPLRIRVLYAEPGLPAGVWERDVEVDGTPPELLVEEPEAESSDHAEREVAVVGRLSEPHFTALRMNGRDVPVDEKGRFRATFLLPENGRVLVTIEASDAIGNVAKTARALQHRPAPKTPLSGGGAARVRSVGLVLAADGRLSWNSSDPAYVLGKLGPAREAGDAFEALRVALRASVKAQPRDADGASSVSLEMLADPQTPWLDVENVTRCAAAPEFAVSRFRFAEPGTGVYLQARVPRPGPDAPTVQVRLAGEVGWQTLVSVSSKQWTLPDDRTDPRRGVFLGELGTYLATRLRALPETRFEVRVPLSESKGVRYRDVLDVLRVFTKMGIPQVRLVLDAAALPRPTGAPIPQPPAPREAPAPTPPPAAAPAAPETTDKGVPRPFRARAAPEAASAPQLVRAAVDHGLRWLAAHQSPEGMWECSFFDKWCDGKPAAEGRRPDGLGKPMYDVGVTGLALCAFLGAGYTDRGDHPFAKVVSKGLRWLRDAQDEEGCFGPRMTQHYIYCHATAALAAVEAYGMTGSPVHRASAQKALDFIEQARNPYFAWRYGVKPGDNDTSVTGWMMMALKSAKLIDDDFAARGLPPPLRIDEEAFEGIKAWIDKMTDKDYGRVGYIQRGSGGARPQELVDRFPLDRTESTTAVGCLARIFLGEDPRKSELIPKSVSLMLKVLPTYNTQDGSIDMYYWYYGTLAMFQVGGDPWKRWSDAMQAVIAGNQRMDTDYCQFKGSWEPVDPWGPDGGRVYSTAMCTMCLEVYYRYDKVFAGK